MSPKAAGAKEDEAKVATEAGVKASLSRSPEEKRMIDPQVDDKKLVEAKEGEAAHREGGSRRSRSSSRRNYRRRRHNYSSSGDRSSSSHNSYYGRSRYSRSRSRSRRRRSRSSRSTRSRSSTYDSYRGTYRSRRHASSRSYSRSSRDRYSDWHSCSRSRSRSSRWSRSRSRTRTRSRSFDGTPQKRGRTVKDGRVRESKAAGNEKADSPHQKKVLPVIGKMPCLGKKKAGTPCGSDGITNRKVTIQVGEKVSVLQQPQMKQDDEFSKKRQLPQRMDLNSIVAASRAHMSRQRQQPPPPPPLPPPQGVAPQPPPPSSFSEPATIPLPPVKCREETKAELAMLGIDPKELESFSK